MLLKIEERFYIMDILEIIHKDIPLPILRKLHEQLCFSDYEIAEKNLVQIGDVYDWDNDVGKEISFPPDVITKIRDYLKVLDRRGGVYIGLERLCELFVGER